MDMDCGVIGNEGKIARDRDGLRGQYCALEDMLVVKFLGSEVSRQEDGRGSRGLEDVS